MMNCMPYYNIIKYKSTQINVTRNFVDIYVDKSNVPKNLSNAILCIKDELPNDRIRYVSLVIDGQYYDLMTKSGNWLMSDQIIPHVPYLLVYGDNDPHFTVLSCRCIKPTNFAGEEVVMPDGEHLQSNKRRD